MKTIFYYEWNADETLLKRIVCVVCENIVHLKHADDFDNKQLAKGFTNPFSFGSSIFQNIDSQKNLPLKSIRKSLLLTAKGRHSTRPLFTFAADPSQDAQTFRKCIRKAVHNKSVRDAPRLKPNNKQ